MRIMQRIADWLLALHESDDRHQVRDLVGPQRSRASAQDGLRLMGYVR